MDNGTLKNILELIRKHQQGLKGLKKRKYGELANIRRRTSHQTWHQMSVESVRKKAICWL